MTKSIKFLGLLLLLFSMEKANGQSANSTKTVLITGAGSGIGKATAIEFIKKGYTIYTTDKDTSNMAELTQLGCRVLYLDVTVEESMVESIKQIETETGGVDILVNNAGYGQNGVIE